MHAPPAGDDRADATASPNRFDDAAHAQMECFLRDFGEMYQEVTRAHHEALFRLAMAAEYRDNDTGEHIIRMGFLCEALALAMGRTPRWAAMLRKAAPMHDVGKIGIPDKVLQKPGALDEAERATMNEHARIGAEILGQSRIPLFRLAAEVALSHHERWDGSGYPSGLQGSAIPLAGRIVAVVDFFDALTMDRCYRKAFPDAQALQMLREQSGRAFDPEIASAFLAHAPRLVALRDAINRRKPSFAELVDGTTPPQALPT
ncbi:HD-GYP domain-containing protein [Rubrivivax gelatinosus]|uniref:Metal-dependent phosphohydrolase HD sub domain n=1 Tax=Rubrivivax gelatinosus (strain NBRC 100245 / IL144) TaxID=983917 RepID=I0HXV5_RUBGI|nr:putative two-component system response regulator [Rubrivivax gelatinosus]BAL97842.1 metal-dependent phosphohydrolase HD sub domain [Rubrivivax gelatinosus IL144]